MNHASAVHTEITQQSGAGGTKAEGGIFDDRLTIPYRIEEVVKVIVAVGVAGRSGEPLDILRQRASGMHKRIFLAVLLQVLLLHGIGESGNDIAGIDGAWGPGNSDGVPRNLHKTFRSG